MNGGTLPEVTVTATSAVSTPYFDLQIQSMFALMPQFLIQDTGGSGGGDVAELPLLQATSVHSENPESPLPPLPCIQPSSITLPPFNSFTGSYGTIQTTTGYFNNFTVTPLNIPMNIITIDVDIDPTATRNGVTASLPSMQNLLSNAYGQALGTYVSTGNQNADAHGFASTWSDLANQISQSVYGTHIRDNRTTANVEFGIRAQNGLPDGVSASTLGTLRPYP